MDITYSINFHNDWHCGSGLSAGADLDLLVIKDKNGLPFVPGKTVKGLLREAMIDILTFSGEEEKDKTLVNLLGKENEKKDNQQEKEFTGNQGCLFFTNANLEDKVAAELTACNAQKYLYRGISSTAIGEDGVAKKHSLRRMEVTVPCKLTGCIKNVPENHLDLIENSLKYIKRMGQNRNRGLGRCDIILEKGGQS